MAEYSVMGRMRCEACISMCKLLIIDMVKTEAGSNKWQTGILRARQMSTQVNGRSLRSAKQYPEGLKRGVIQVHKQWSRQEQTESKWKAKS